MLIGTEAEVDSLFGRVTAHTPQERAQLARAHASVELERGLPQAALTWLAEADTLEPGNVETYAAQARAHLSRLDISQAKIALSRHAQSNAAVARLRGLSSNPTQSQLGQILDEFLLERVVVDQLLVFCETRTSSDISTILRVVAAHPQSTAAAITLVRALRAVGFVGRLAPEDTSLEQQIVKSASIPRPCGRIAESRM